jgi:hypothetical protein
VDDQEPAKDHSELWVSLQRLTNGTGVQREDLLEALGGELGALQRCWGVNLNNGVKVARDIILINLDAHLRRLKLPKSRRALSIEQRQRQYFHGILVGFNAYNDEHHAALKAMNLGGRQKWLQDDAPDLLKIGARTSRRELADALGQIEEQILAAGYEPVDTSNLPPDAEGGESIFLDAGQRSLGEPLDTPTSARAENAVTRRSVSSELQRAKEDLAESVEQQLREERRLQRVGDPFPLPVCWKDYTHASGDHYGNIHRVRSEGAPLALDGTLDDICAKFNSIPSRRLVVLGKPGSGKSVLLLELALTLLNNRSADDPIPVIFNIGSWKPNGPILLNWLADQVATSHRFAKISKRSRRMRALSFIRNGHILPILDGFDEIGDGSLEIALRAIDATFDPDCPLVLSSRRVEYEAAVAASGVVSSAAVVLLRDLAFEDVITYLPRSSAPIGSSAADGTMTTKWNAVFAQLDDPSNEQLRNLLKTPLMVSLARMIYSETSADPVTLLDSTRFPDIGSLNDHLLDNFIKSRYELGFGRAERRWSRSLDSDAIERYFAFLALYLHGRSSRQFLGDLPDRTGKSMIGSVLFTSGGALLLMQAVSQGGLNLYSLLLITIGWSVISGLWAVILSALMRKPKFGPKWTYMLFKRGFMADAHRRGILRRNGTFYQFRHAMIQDRLALNLLNNKKHPARYKTIWMARRNLAIELYRERRFRESAKEMGESMRLQLTPPFMRWRYRKTKVKFDVDANPQEVSISGATRYWSLTVKFTP